MVVEYKCSNCGKVIAEGDFIAVIGRAPKAGFSTPVGRADKIFESIGNLCCSDCFLSLGARELINLAEGAIRR